MVIDKANIESGEEIAEDIVQCLNVLYSTVAGTQPMDREFGIDASFIGMPVDVIKNQYALEVIEKTEIYEPRVNVLEVTFTMNGDILIPTIHVERTEEEDE